MSEHSLPAGVAREVPRFATIVKTDERQVVSVVSSGGGSWNVVAETAGAYWFPGLPETADGQRRYALTILDGQQQL